MFAAEALDIVQLGLRRGADAAAFAALGLAPPGPGQVSRAGALELLWIQPNTFLLLAPRGAMPALDAFTPIAAIVEQSDGRAAFTLSGPLAREVLARGCRLDFHPRVFGPGQVASTSFAHVNAVIQQTSDAPQFRIIVFSSFAAHIAEFLAHTLAAA